ncbi:MULTISPECIES: GapA-binding peptide SR1P [Cytobacillus]|nr:GapA-binding peptide SR1P [Cytobacillus kochii]MCA1027624.1 GapA-binding peptide SR1P [Cytobacillus kochii]MCM3321867.1 GapA-binding peptide SR1P [Cytobacillus kochii]MCM3343299.1 GapA-binding peptide SR1P [Cytobacillus kochii]MDM5207129.1 GapA-binding peptide SR1P [Cytobacillus kochii]
MGTIVCQICDETIEVFEDEKVSVLYGQCGCKNEHSKMHIEE